MSFWTGKRVLVTGAAGFIGSNLLPRLLERGAKVRAVDNLERGKLEYIRGVLRQVEFRKLDLRERQNCLQACRGMDVVIHLASKVGGIGYYMGKPSDVLMQAVLMDAFMLQGVLAAGVERYFYASSAHIYPIELQQDIRAVFIKEPQAIPAHPELSYGWGKLIGEKQIEYAVAQGLPLKAAVFRLIGAYGPNQDLDLATGSCIPVFCRRAIEYPRGKPFRVLGTGRETRSYCYIDDVLDALLRSVEKLAAKRPLVGPLNVGSEDLVSIADLAKMIIEISGKDIPIVFDRSHKTVIWGQALDCSRAAKELGGWRPKVSLREGLERVYRHVEGRLAK